MCKRVLLGSVMRRCVLIESSHSHKSHMNQILYSLLFRLIALLLGVQEEMTQRTNALQDHAHGNLLEDDKIIMIGFIYAGRETNTMLPILNMVIHHGHDILRQN